MRVAAAVAVVAAFTWWWRRGWRQYNQAETAMDAAMNRRLYESEEN